MAVRADEILDAAPPGISAVLWPAGDGDLVEDLVQQVSAVRLHPRQQRGDRRRPTSAPQRPAFTLCWRHAHWGTDTR